VDHYSRRHAPLASCVKFPSVGTPRFNVVNRTLPLVTFDKEDQTPTASVVITCFTEQRLSDIFEAVTSVRRQILPPNEIILVVDSNRKLYERLKGGMDRSVHVVLNEGVRGLSAARNVGIGLAQSHLVAFLDDDAVADPEWLLRLTELFRDPDVAAGGGRAVLQWSEGRPAWFPEELDWTVGGSVSWGPLEPTVVRNPHGFSMCFRREVFEVMGDFAVDLGNIGETYRGGEEVELCLRMAHHWPAAKVVWEPRAVVIHKIPASKATLPAIMRRAYYEGFQKRWIRLTAPTQDAGRVLSTERAYLKHMLGRALPSRLRYFWRPKDLLQAVTIILCVAATGAGYLLGTTRNKTSSSRSARRSGRGSSRAG